ncbi:MAG: sensor histidine kinase [Chitinophagaceae bacterium]
MDTKSKARRKSRFGYQAKFYGVILMSLISCHNCICQYFPRPAPIKSNQQTALQHSLKESIPGTERVDIFLDLSNSVLHIPTRTRADLERAMKYARDAGELGSSLGYKDGFTRSQLAIANIFTLRNDFRNAEAILAELEDSAKIDLLLNLSFKYRQRPGEAKEQDLKMAADYAEHAATLSASLHFREKEIMAQRILASIHADLRNSGAEMELINVLKQYQLIGYNRLHYVYEELAFYHYNMGNPDKALYYSQETIKSMLATGDTADAADFYAIHSMICQNNDEYQTSLDFSYKAINSFRAFPGQFPVSQILALVTGTLRKMHRYDEALRFMKVAKKEFPAQDVIDEIAYLRATASIYRDMKQFGMAEKYLIQCFNLQKKNELLNYAGYLAIGQLYVEWGQFARAKPYVYKGSKMPLIGISSAGKRHLSYMLFLIDSATGDYLSAIRRKNEFNTLEDYRLRQVKEKEVQKLNVQFETEKKVAQLRIKDQNIQFLEKSAKLQQTNLRQEKMIRNFTIAAIIMLLIITVQLYRQYRQKQKSTMVITDINKIISQKNRSITQKNEALEHLVAEKEWLLKEVHHRVKNNLHTVICLLESQAAYLKNDALQAIEDSQHRIYAMSLIHQKLYQTDISTIDMNTYLPQFVQYLDDSFGASDRIRIHSDIGSIKLEAIHAGPVALIINEAVTNSIKYAFPDKRKGNIFITLTESRDYEVELIIADNGIGMDPKIINTELNSLGIHLIRGLGKEIGAQVEFGNEGGTTITVRFRHAAFVEAGQPLLKAEKEAFH